MDASRGEIRATTPASPAESRRPLVKTIPRVLFMEPRSCSPTKTLVSMRTAAPFPKQYAMKIPLTRPKDDMAESPSLPAYFNRILLITMPLIARQNTSKAPGNPVLINGTRSIQRAFLNL